VTVRVLIADDEPPARLRVRSLLAKHPDYLVVGEAGDGAEAVDVLLAEGPDLIFLDIMMPELDGFEVIEAVAASGGPAPAIVFVTASEAFARQAFDVGAIDYLLKPFDQDRLDRALARVGERLRKAEPGLSDSLRTLLAGLGARPVYPARFLVRTGRRMHFVRVADVDWIDARGNYARLHVAGRTHLVRETMHALEAKLDPAIFIRVHRSAIVNVDRIGAVEPYRNGEFTITMRDGGWVRSSASYNERVRRLLA
jgi:two-component system LytT family response regulator